MMMKLILALALVASAVAFMPNMNRARQFA
jgi:hypothetical protein